jgi:hypothetical protein
VESGYRELWERRRFEHDRSERRMPWGAPQDSGDDSQPRSTPQPRGASAKRRAGKTWQRGPRSTNTAGPPWSRTPTGSERGAVEAQGGTATEKETFSESPARARSRTLGLAQVSQRKSRTARRRQEAASAQATVPGPGRLPGPLQLMGPGDHPMQKLALMMAVMMLGMSPAHGCSTSRDHGGQVAGSQAETMFPPSTWSSSGGEALMTERRISSTASR